MKNEEFLRLLGGIDEKLIDNAGKDLEDHHKTATQYAAGGNYRKKLRRRITAAAAEKEAEVVLKPQYFRPDPSLKSGTTFKRVMIAVAAVVCVAAVSIFIRMNNKPETMPPNDSLGALSGDSNGNSDIEDTENLEKLAGEIYIKYDRSEYENITAPKRYYADYHKIDQEAFLNLFSSEPQYSEGSGTYFTDTESGYNTENRMSLKGGQTSFYNMSYSTQTGDDYDTAANQNCKKYSLTREFDFMTRDALREDLLSKTKGIIPGGLQFDSYAIDAESYLKEAENYDGKKEWMGANDYYYIKAQQMVDGIPICESMHGDFGKGTLMEGCRIKAVYTKNGLEYLSVLCPWRVDKEAPIEGKFIDLHGAEEIIKAENENLLTSKKHIIESVRLVYVPLVKEEGIVLTPAWEFYDHMGAQYPVYTIDAYTGEMLK